MDIILPTTEADCWVAPSYLKVLDFFFPNTELKFVSYLSTCMLLFCHAPGAAALTSVIGLILKVGIVFLGK